MKRKLLILGAGLLLAAALLPFLLSPLALAAAQSAVPYAHIRQNGVRLYHKSADGYLPVCALPRTYFVAVTGAEEDGYLPVGYLDIAGYVKASEVAFVDFEPKNKYAEAASLTVISDGHEVRLRRRPDHTADNVIGTVPPGAVLYYYGQAVGAPQVAPLGDLWYFVRYTAGGTTTRGYIYNLYADAAPIPDNAVEAADPPAAAAETPSPDNGDPLVPGGALSTVVIVCMCIPVVVVCALLYRRQTLPR
ncbi:MAG: hypothetical protein LBH24_04010 [Clostridiales bacterium]|jgi:hypothetical protein|nr:hypothetical protein [Clostridiales bacterium]